MTEIKIKTPDQALYDAAYHQSANVLQYPTYTFLPKQGTAYPFVTVQNVQDLPSVAKMQSMGNLELTIDIFGKGNDRMKVSEMAKRLYSRLIYLEKGRLRMLQNQSSIQVLQDQSTDEDLWRAIMTLRFRYSY